MTPEEIKSKIVLEKKTLREIAQKAGVVPSAVTMIIQRKGKSQRLQQLIADEIGMPYEEVWGTKKNLGIKRQSSLPGHEI